MKSDDFYEVQINDKRHFALKQRWQLGLCDWKVLEAIDWEVGRIPRRWFLGFKSLQKEEIISSLILYLQ